MKQKIKKQYSKEFKFKVAFAALRGDKTTSMLCKEFGVHEGVIHKWKKTLKEKGSSVFESSSATNIYKECELKQRLRELSECIGEITIENRFLKKNLNL